MLAHQTFDGIGGSNGRGNIAKLSLSPGRTTVSWSRCEDIDSLFLISQGGNVHDKKPKLFLFIDLHAHTNSFLHGQKWDEAMLFPIAGYAGLLTKFASAPGLLRNQVPMGCAMKARNPTMLRRQVMDRRTFMSAASAALLAQRQQSNSRETSQRSATLFRGAP